MTTEHRVFVGWGEGDKDGYMSSLHGSFQTDLQEMVERLGPPTRVEFRADGEGWTDGDGNDLPIKRPRPTRAHQRLDMHLAAQRGGGYHRALIGRVVRKLTREEAEALMTILTSMVDDAKSAIRSKARRFGISI